MYTRFSQKKTILVENEPFICVWKNILTVVHIIYNLHLLRVTVCILGAEDNRRKNFRQWSVGGLVYLPFSFLHRRLELSFQLIRWQAKQAWPGRWQPLLRALRGVSCASPGGPTA